MVRFLLLKGGKTRPWIGNRSWRKVMELDRLVRRIRSEFLEMPGLRLTTSQAARLWGLEEALCNQVISALIGSAFLRRTSSGTISRADA